MSEPTPTPWRAIHQYIFSGDHAIPIASGHKEYATNPNGELYAQAQANAAFIVKAANHFDALVKALNDIMQRANESSSGEMGLLDTIHAMNGIAREVLASIKDERI